MTWLVRFTFDVDGDADQLIEWDEQLADNDGTVSRNDIGVDVSVYIDADDPIAAAAQARTIVGAVIMASPQAVEVITEDEQARRASAPTLPELVSGPEVGDILGVTRQRVHQLRSTSAFPKPLFELRAGPIWDARAIRAFAKTWTRTGGRPASSVRSTTVFKHRSRLTA